MNTGVCLPGQKLFKYTFNNIYKFRFYCFQHLQMTVQIVCFSYSTEFVARPHLNPFPVAVRLTYSQSLYCLPYFFVIWGFAFPIGWILNSVFSIIWRRGRIVSFATPSVFLIGSPFSFSLYNEFSTLKLSTQINAVNWACPVTDFQLYSLTFRTCKQWENIPCC